MTFHVILFPPLEWSPLHSIFTHRHGKKCWSIQGKLLIRNERNQNAHISSSSFTRRQMTGVVRITNIRRMTRLVFEKNYRASDQPEHCVCILIFYLSVSQNVDSPQYVTDRLRQFSDPLARFQPIGGEYGIPNFFPLYIEAWLWSNPIIPSAYTRALAASLCIYLLRERGAAPLFTRHDESRITIELQSYRPTVFYAFQYSQTYFW